MQINIQLQEILHLLYIIWCKDRDKVAIAVFGPLILLEIELLIKSKYRYDYIYKSPVFYFHRETLQLACAE